MHRREALYKADMKNDLNIAIAGCAGRMGRQLAIAAMDAGHRVSGGSEISGSSAIGEDIGHLIGRQAVGATVQEDIVSAAQGADIWIDFTVPAATLDALSTISAGGISAVIIGTTGFTSAQEEKIEEAAASLSVVKAGNFSLGINLLEALVRQTASRLGEDWDVEILETHHRHKVDAPSGTALMLGHAAADGRQQRLEKIRSAPYDGADAKRVPGEIGFSVRRSGGVIGDHEITFSSETETLSLRHTATDRTVFAYGAIKAAEWAVLQAPGLYNMSDVLGVS